MARCRGPAKGRDPTGVVSTIMWPVFSSKWQWSLKKLRCIDIPLFPDLHRDSLPCYAFAGGLAARLCVKRSPSVVADSKERRRRALPEYASKCATIWEKSHSPMQERFHYSSTITRVH